jgi:hypothetical protein
LLFRARFRTLLRTSAGPIADVLQLFNKLSASPLLDDKEVNMLRFHPLFANERSSLLRGTFLARDAGRLLLALRNTLATTTRYRVTAESGLVLNGPIGDSTGQAGTSLLLALRGTRVLCAKVGPARLRSEFTVSARLAPYRCPAVLLIESCDHVPKQLGHDDLVALVMPVYPMSLAAVVLALPPGPSATRNEVSRAVALHGLAAIAAFSLAGMAHGDIKPSNFVLGGAGEVVLIDFGTARPLGGSFTESSIFNLNEPREATTFYDLVCLGATLAHVQFGTLIDDGVTTRASLLDEVYASVTDATRDVFSVIRRCLDPTSEVRADAGAYVLSAALLVASEEQARAVWPSIV